MKKVWDFHHDSKFIYSSLDFGDMKSYVKDYLGSEWEKRGKLAVWDRTVDGLKETCRISLRSYKGLALVDRKNYYSNKKIRRKVDAELKKLAYLQAQIGTKQKDDEQIVREMAEITEVINTIDPTFLNNENEYDAETERKN